MRLDLRKLRDPTTYLSVQEQRRANRAIRDADRRRRLDPLRYAARPHPVQERVHTFTTKQCLLVAANRFGKSTAGTWEVLWRATNTHPYRNFERPHRVIWCGFPNYLFYQRVTSRLFKLWMPEDYFLAENKNEKRLTFQRKGGGVCDVYFLSYDSDPQAWAGGAVDFLWLDEEPPEEISREAFARTIDTRGQILRTYTPITGMAWMYDQLYLPAKEGKRDITVIEGALAEFKEDAYLNVGRPLVPHLTRKDIIGFAEEYPDEAERLIRIFGQYAKRAGLIFREFDTKIHRIPRFPIPEEWTLGGFLDPGYHGFAAGLLAFTPKGRIVAVDEYFSQQETTDVRLERLAEMVHRHRHSGPEASAVVFVCDTEDPQLVLDLNLAASRKHYPLVFTQLDQGLKAVKAGILRVQQVMHPQPGRDRLDVPKGAPRLERPTGFSKGEPLFYVMEGLHSVWRAKEKTHEGCRLIWELERLQWRVVKEESRDEPDKTTADGAHMLDGLRYGIMARMGPLEANDEVEVPEDRDQWVWDQLAERERAIIEAQTQGDVL